jgi:hypothetical protein
MELSGQLHTPSTAHTGKNPVPIDLEAGEEHRAGLEVSEEMNNFLLLPGLEPRIVQSVVNYMSSRA